MLFLILTSFMGLMTMEAEREMQSSENDLSTANIYFAEAIFLTEETEYSNAIACSKEALNIYRRHESMPSYLDCLNHLSSQYRHLSLYDSAKRYAIVARSTLVHLPDYDPARIMTTYKNVGAYFDETGLYDSALYYYSLSLTFAKKEMKTLPEYAPDLYNVIGGVHQDLGDYDKAMTNADTAISLSKEVLGDMNLTLANSYRNKARTFVELEDYNSALIYFNKTLHIQQELLGECSPSTANTYSNIAILYDNKWKFHQALNYHFRALEIFQDSFGEMHIEVIESYDNIGGIYTSLKDFDKANLYFTKALKLAHKVLGEEHPTTSNLYLSLGVNYGNNGHEDIALEYFLKELDMSERISGKKHPNTAYSHYNIGQYFRDRGDSRIAFKHFHKALKIWKSALGNANHHISDILMSLGILFEDQQQYDSAGHYYTKAHAINQMLATEPTPELAISYNSIGFIQEILGNYDSAMQLSQKALAIQIGLFGEHHAHVSYSYNRLGHLDYLMNKPKEAIRYFKKSLDANNKSPLNGMTIDDMLPSDLHDVEYAIQSLQGIVLCHETIYGQEGDITLLQEGLDLLLQAESVLDIERQNLIRNGDRIYHSKIYARFYNQSVWLCHDLYQRIGDKTYLEHAYRFSQKTKANALSDLVMELSAKNASQIPVSLKTLEDSLRKDISFCQTKINALESVSESDSLHHFYNSRIFDQKRRFDSLTQYFEQNYPKYYTLKQKNYLFNLDSLQSYLREDEAILEFFIGEQSIFLFTLTNKNQSFYQIEKSKHFEEDVRNCREQLSMNPLTNENDSLNLQLFNYASSFYKKYLHPALIKLDPNKLKLIIIPDGVLGYLPFEMLMFKNSEDTQSSNDSERFLQQKYQISYAHSTALKFGRYTQRETPSKNILAFAPSYLKENIDIPVASSRFNANQLSPLIWNIKEVNSIIKSNGGLALTGPQAQEKAFKEISKDYKVLHIAGHAITDDLNPMKSKLAFGEPKDGAEDGLLHAYEIYDMNINAELTVLSACQTAYGQLAQGEGVMSMARAFSASGCPSLLVSHWPVDDKVTSQIMINFYDYLHQGLRKDEALRLAKMKFLKTAPPAYQHPYFWSSFVLIGNTDPIIFNIRSQENTKYYFIFSLIILASCYLFWRRRQAYSADL